MKSCFFTGHRNAPFDTLLIVKTGHVITDLIENGVTDFYAGGAVGFDTFCEKIVIVLRRKYKHIKLHLVLPCPPEIQSAKWNDEQKEEYNKILNDADDIEILSENYSKDCMKKRNARLAELGDICLCYFNDNNSRSGTGQTVRMAQNAEKRIINMYGFSEE